MPDATEKLDAARKLVGTYCKGTRTKLVYRIIAVDEYCLFTLVCLSLFDDAVHVYRRTNWDAGNDGSPIGTVPISRAEYLAVAGPLFAELGKMAGVTRECEE